MVNSSPCVCWCYTNWSITTVAITTMNNNSKALLWVAGCTLQAALIQTAQSYMHVTAYGVTLPSSGQNDSDCRNCYWVSMCLWFVAASNSNKTDQKATIVWHVQSKDLARPIHDRDTGHFIPSGLMKNVVEFTKVLSPEGLFRIVVVFLAARFHVFLFFYKHSLLGMSDIIRFQY